jgi:hypothetical protein
MPETLAQGPGRISGWIGRITGPADSQTDVGANFLFGVGARGDVIPYLQGKLIVSDDTEFVIAFGLRF